MNILKSFTSILFVFTLIALTTGNLFAQKNIEDNSGISNPKNEKEYEQLYERNIRKSRINGVYIPADLNEAFAELDALSPPESVEKFKNAPEEVIETKLHFGLGRWIYIFWNFEEGSRYVEHLKQLGLMDFDHMIMFTIVTYHRHKNNKPLNVEELVEKYRQERLKYIEELKSRTEITPIETKKIDKE